MSHIPASSQQPQPQDPHRMTGQHRYWVWAGVLGFLTAVVITLGPLVWPSDPPATTTVTCGVNGTDNDNNDVGCPKQPQP